MKNLYVFLTFLAIFTFFSNASAARYPSDMLMEDPTADITAGAQWMKDDASPKPCASDLRDLTHCRNNHPKFDWKYACYAKRQAYKMCWKLYYAKIEDACRQYKNQYLRNIDSGNYQLANEILYSDVGNDWQNRECDWKKREKQQIKEYYCKKGIAKFRKAISAPLDEFACRQILQENAGCSWHKEASTALYKALRGPDFSSDAASRPTYSPGSTEVKKKNITQKATCPPGTKESAYDNNRCFVISTLSPYGMTTCSGKYAGFELTSGGRCAQYKNKQ